MKEPMKKADHISVKEFLGSVSDDKRRADSFTILELMKQVTEEEPVMWGNGMVGFGSYHYKYESGREGDWFLTGFSPRKGNLVVYITAGFDSYEGLMKKLGKYKTGKSCLYINKLEDIDLDVLEELVVESIAFMKKRWMLTK